MPRRSYVKSRGGCASCKKRRVKCDEKVPCSACTRHQTHCTLSVLKRPLLPTRTRTGRTSPPQSPSVQTASSPSSQVEQSHPSVTTRDGNDGSRCDLGATSPAVAYPSSLQTPPSPWLQDLELLHHYHAHTRHTLPGASDFGQLHEIVFVELALADEVMMHQLLAVAAFHKASSLQADPEQRRQYSLRALKHQTDGAGILRCRLGRLTPENSHTCLETSTLLTIGSFAAKCDAHPRLDDLMSMFFSCRGLYAIGRSEMDALRDGPLREKFAARKYTRDAPTLRKVCERLYGLSGRLGEMHKAALTLDDDPLAIVQSEIYRLIRIIHGAIETAFAPPEWRVVLLWPMTFSDTFINLLSQKNHLALVLIAHFCAIVHLTEPFAWWVKGWGPSVLQDVQWHLAGSRNESLLRWPLHSVGLFASSTV